MQRLPSLIFFLFFASAVIGQNAVRFEIKSLPPYDNSDSEIFLAGSFNGWNPQDKNFQFNKTANGNYFLEIKLNSSYYEYKITRGGWDKVECTDSSEDVLNRQLKINSDTTIEITIQGWKDHFSPVAVKRKNTTGKNVQIIDTAFLIPQLQRTRRIWVYLPDGYNTSTHRYPVLYMHDGQNVFDDATSYAGEWGVDECIDTMKKKSIVVAIDNGGTKRLNEYCPYDFSLSGSVSGKGEGKQYVDFIVKNLKPFIDKKYRTLTDSDNTFIAGSSMGGLISMYAILHYPEVFGGAGIFSPAFWVGPAIFDEIKNSGEKVKGRIYFYAGGAESETMVPGTEKAYELMKQFPNSKETIVIVKDGLHNEPRWRIEFAEFYKWMIN